MRALPLAVLLLAATPAIAINAAFSASAQFIASSVYCSGPVYVSGDHGQSFAPKNNQQGLSPCVPGWADVAVSADGQHMLAADNHMDLPPLPWPSPPGCGTGKVYQSSDYGSTWNATHLPNRSWHNVVMSANATLRYVTTGPNIFASSDGGRTWGHLWGAGTDIVFLTASEDARYLAAAGRFSPSHTVIFLSDDYGSTWRRVFFEGPLGSEYNAVTLSADGQRVAVLVGQVTRSPIINFSDDFGRTWPRTTNMSALGNPNGIAMSADGRYMLSGNSISNTSIFVSSDYGHSFASIQAPLGRWFTFAVSRDGATMAAVSDRCPGLALSTDFGRTWTIPDLKPPTSSAAHGAGRGADPPP
eukprot:m.263969 g.263969  ORF g.263969 m.263969 type:complete len:358 (+) comp27419_c0_seq1:63-1136(+)